MTVLYDLETDNLLPGLTKLHCMCMLPVGSKKVLRYHDDPTLPATGTLAQGLDVLSRAETRAAHNGLGFDEPALRQLYPDWAPKGTALDTMVLASIAWPEGRLQQIDLNRGRVGIGPTKLMVGSHRLADWGLRLGARKMSELVHGDYTRFTEDMLTYCVRDVEILGLLWDHVWAKGALTQRAVALEHEFAEILVDQQAVGVAIDEPALDGLITDLLARQTEIDEILGEAVGTRTVRWTTPVRKEERSKEVEWNLNSRDQVVEILTTRGWRPLAFSKKTKKPRLAEEDLELMVTEGIEHADLFLERFRVTDRLGQAFNGQASWTKMLDKPTSTRPGGELPGPRRLHGRIKHNATITHRCAHSGPNLGNVPNCEKDPLWGPRCRAVFVSRPGYSLVGVDAASLELRGMAHYLGRVDGGAYRDTVLRGDPHQAGMAATGMTERGAYKARFYALLYGAQDPKLGRMGGEDRAGGTRFRQRLLSGIKGFGAVVADVQSKVSKPGYLHGLDGRRIFLRGQHSAWNSLNQAFGALVVKQATVNLSRAAAAAGYVRGRDWEQVLHVHDEFQLEVPDELAEEFGRLGVQAFRDTTEQFGLRCPMDGAAKIGKRWSETH